METTYENALVINVVALDRPAIVSGIARAVDKMGGTIDACSQTVVGEYFTLIMIASFAGKICGESLKDAISSSGGDLNVLVLDYQASDTSVELACDGGDNFVFTVFGTDRSGITLKFSSLMADRGINIFNLYGTRQGEYYILMGQIHIPSGWDLDMLKAELEHIAGEMDQSITLQHENVFVATNQIRPPYANFAADAQKLALQLKADKENR